MNIKIRSIINDKIIEKMWDELRDILVDENAEHIEQDFYHWKSGSSKEDIWHWFDDNYSKGLMILMCVK